VAKSVAVREAPVAQAVAVPLPAALGRASDARVERWIARVLRGGALLSGGLFAASLAAEALPASVTTHVGVDVLRKGAASVLLVTPVARVVMAGAALGARGEWRYVACASGVLALLALAVGTGAGR
jgi:hypothetical protein